MSLGLSPSLSRRNLKLIPNKADMMIIQAIGLFDNLDEDLNTYGLRVREWYGWHFPNLAKIITDNILNAKAVKLMGSRDNAANLDFSEILPEEVEAELKEAAMISCLGFFLAACINTFFRHKVSLPQSGNVSHNIRTHL